MATSYNGWPASRDPAAIGVNTSWEPIPGHRFPGGIKGGDVEVVFTELVRRLDAEVEPIELYADGDEWGYAFRGSVNSPELLSCHASATAIDYNATRHPNGVHGTWSPTQVAGIRRILDDLGGVIFWRGDARGTPDEMHFEIAGTPAEVAAVAARITNRGGLMPSDVDRLDAKLDQLIAAALTSIDEGRKLDAQVPNNAEAELDELRVNVRTLLGEVNRLRQREGLSPLPIVVGRKGTTNIYAPGTAP